MKKLLVVLLMGTLVFAAVPLTLFGADKANPQKELVIADLNSGGNPNNLGGDFGTWNKEPIDTDAGSEMSFVKDDAKGNPSGYSVRLDYKVNTLNQTYSGFWMNFNGYDFTSYNTLNFYIKGDADAGFTKTVKIELRDTRNQPFNSYMVRGITDQWQKISIPFNKFRGIGDWAHVDRFVVVFDDQNSRPKTGSIYIDQISISNW